VRILLVRHGATLWSASGQFTGRTDLPLTQEGEKEARRLGGLLRNYSPRLVLSSPLSRAFRTATLAGFAGASIDSDLMEWNYGLNEGQTMAAVHEKSPSWDLWRDGAPGGESASDVAKRVARILNRARNVDGDTLLFSHAHVLRVLIATWLGLAPDLGRHFVLPTGRLSILGTEHDWTAILALNLAPPTRTLTPKKPWESRP